MDGSAPPAPLPATRIVITGRGVLSAIGTSVDAFETNLAAGSGGIGAHENLMPGQTVHVGLVGAFEAPAGLAAVAPACDRTARLAATAAAQALTEAGFWDGAALTVPGEDVALLLGSSHGGRSQIDRFVAGGMDCADAELARGVMAVGAHQRQTAVVATLLGVRGPVMTLSTACSSSGTAIVHGVDLLRSGQARMVVAGGADAFSLLTLAGFQALGAVADEACGPFGQRTGISLGEGAAFVVLERLDDVRARNGTPVAEIFGCATTWDAYHLTAPEPSGDGMRRAIEEALGVAGLPVESIDYINAHGTGTRANDIAETLAIKRVFPVTPPVSATKSFTGHTLGASSAAGLLAGIAGSRGGWLPPTLNFGAGRAGCDLDYVPERTRPASVAKFLALSAAFGGCNCAIAAGAVDAGGFDAGTMRAGDVWSAAPDAVVITGLGVISPLGCDLEAAYAAALAPGGDEASEIAQVRDFDARRMLRGRGARMNRITQYAVAAIEQALVQAGWPAARRRPNRIGLMVALSRGAAGSFEACMESVRGGAWTKASPTAFPNLVMSSVGGQAAVAVGLKGAATTMVGEGDVGIALLGQAAGLLARRPWLDAVVVLAADELTPLFLRLDRAAHGPPARKPAEGAVALVLERRGLAAARGAQAKAEIAGWAQGFGTRANAEDDGESLARTVRAAMRRANETADVIDFVLTAALADGMDRVLPSVFGNALPPVGSLDHHGGSAEASGNLLAVVTAVQALRHGKVPTAGGVRLGTFSRAVVAGASREGGNAAVLLRAPDRIGAAA